LALFDIIISHQVVHLGRLCLVATKFGLFIIFETWQPCTTFAFRVCEPARGRTQLMEPNNEDVYYWTDKVSKIKYRSYKVKNLFITLNHEISERELVDKVLHSLKKGLENNSIDSKKMVDEDYYFNGLYKEKVLINYKNENLFIFNKYVWMDNRGNSYSSVDDYMYYDSIVDKFATIDPNIAKKLPEESLNKYRNYLDKGFVTHENHSTGIKPLGNEAFMKEII